MKNNFSRQVKEAISLGHEEAIRLESDSIGTGHLLLGLIRQDHSPAVAILKNLELPELKKEVEMTIGSGKEKVPNPVRKVGLFKFFSRPSSPRSRMPLNKQAETAIFESVLQAKEAKSPTVEASHLLLAILKHTEDMATQVLGRFGVDYDKARIAFMP